MSVDVEMKVVFYISREINMKRITNYFRTYKYQLIMISLTLITIDLGVLYTNSVEHNRRYKETIKQQQILLDSLMKK